MAQRVLSQTVEKELPSLRKTSPAGGFEARSLWPCGRSFGKSVLIRNYFAVRQNNFVDADASCSVKYHIFRNPFMNQTDKPHAQPPVTPPAAPKKSGWK